MTISKYIINRFFLIILTLFTLSWFNTISAQDADGKTLFLSKCASCHAPDMKTNSTGPALFGVEGQWEDKSKLHEWIRNNQKLIASGYPQAVETSKLTANVMSVFPDLTDPQIDAILKYIDEKGSGKLDGGKGGQANGPAGAAAGEGDSSQHPLLYGVITLILALAALILIFVNRNLKKISDDTEGKKTPDAVPFLQNKIYLATAAILLFIVGGYFTTKAMINMNRQKNYEPKQPIFYSHKVHAGINQINCLYCHGNAWESKTAAIPSVNVCMNCHKTIQKYNGPELKDKNGNPVDGTAEIAKLYQYAGFDPQNPDAWDANKAKPIDWVKIHNLPDHVYFNHSQHVRVGNVQCQTCHGEITGMDEVHQFAELSMGWCVNCHRQTKVNFNVDSASGNQFYSIYEKFHNDIKSGKMDSVTVKDIGGLECQKCHY
ncbi:c-type cytochrome [Niabella drilacis]|uniref:Cytochrome c n=1 Tax=Niabella drilacis (strain DSM 25811 / CCM 8410 / CCUG 62505 / LMG 26954 / E90) TaxID=1285928 RepID=A0A1G6YN23_NIADE|nr:c-type cytochrome [Niabella drilacis]SDD91067.1 Cytochrome c [Niabella drilacis]